MDKDKARAVEELLDLARQAGVLGRTGAGPNPEDLAQDPENLAVLLQALSPDAALPAELRQALTRVLSALDETGRVLAVKSR